MLRFPSAAGFLGIGIWGAQGSKAVKLPITVGPKTGGEQGYLQLAVCH